MDDDLTRDLGAAVALACSVPALLVRLTLTDGRVLRVSHDDVFRPHTAPCQLRDALAQPCRSLWIPGVQSVELCGPLVDASADGVVSWTHGTDAHAVSSSHVAPDLLLDWLRTLDPPGVDRDTVVGRLSVYPALAVSVLALESDTLAAPALVELARWIRRTTVALDAGAARGTRQRT